jgi:hypothetical protein
VNEPWAVQARLGGLVLLAPRAGCAAPKPSEMPRSVHTVLAHCPRAWGDDCDSSSVSSEDSEDQPASCPGTEGARWPVLCHQASDDTPSKPTFRRFGGDSSEPTSSEDEASGRGTEAAGWAVLCRCRPPLRRLVASPSGSSEDSEAVSS